jgi:hypothetical protein
MGGGPHVAHPRAGRPARPHVQRRDRRRCGGAAPQSRACRPHDTRPCRPHHDTGTVTFSIRTFSKPATALAKSLTRPAAWFNTSAPTGAFCSAEADNVRSYAAAGRFLSDAQQRRGYSGPVADAPLPPRLSPKVRAHQLWHNVAGPTPQARSLSSAATGKPTVTVDDSSANVKGTFVASGGDACQRVRRLIVLAGNGKSCRIPAPAVGLPRRTDVSRQGD